MQLSDNQRISVTTSHMGQLTNHEGGGQYNPEFMEPEGDKVEIPSGGQYNPEFMEPEGDEAEIPNETFPSPAEAIDTEPPYISEDDAREAFLGLAEKHCCYSSAPAKNMTIEKIETFITHKYALETFTEERKTAWKTAPYFGGEVDGPSNGPAPEPWEVPVICPDWFVARKDKIKVPHTSEVQMCVQCLGHGNINCMKCLSTGQSTCIACCGSGWSSDHACYSCGGSGRGICMSCGGSGSRECITCLGTGKLLIYLQLTVKWKNHYFEFIADHKSDFKTERFKKVTGEVVFFEEQQMVPPVTSFPETSIMEASENVISQHRNEFANCEILRQRHSIEWLPLCKVNYTWKDKEYDYYVYGREKRAYTREYPRKCCCIIM